MFVVWCLFCSVNYQKYAGLIRRCNIVLFCSVDYQKCAVLIGRCGVVFVL